MLKEHWGLCSLPGWYDTPPPYPLGYPFILYLAVMTPPYPLGYPFVPYLAGMTPPSPDPLGYPFISQGHWC